MPVYSINGTGMQKQKDIIDCYDKTAMNYAKKFLNEPIDGHLKDPFINNPLLHLFKTIAKAKYIRAYLLSMVLMLALWMLVPFNTVFISNNAGVSIKQLPVVFLPSHLRLFLVKVSIVLANIDSC